MASAITTPEEEIQNTLQELEALAARGLLIYALMDAAQPALNWQTLTKIFEPSALHPLFAGLPEDSAKEAGPLLWPIEWRALRSQPLRWLLMQEQQSPCVTWLVSDAKPQQLIAHLQSRLFTHTANGDEVLLRFYDPRVLELLMHNLYDDAQRRALAGPIQQWWLWSAERGRQRLRFAGGDSPKVALTAAQMTKFDDYARQRFIRQLTDELRIDYPALLAPLPLPLAQRMIARQIQYAQQQHDITLQTTLATYLHYCCTLGPTFDQQKNIRQMLGAAAFNPNEVPAQLHELVAPLAWQRAQQQANLSAWFDDSPQGQDDQRIARYVWALPSHAAQQTEAELQQLLTQSRETAAALQIYDEDGLIATMVCLQLFGPEFIKQPQPSWLAEIGNARVLPISLRSATMRGNLALDHHIYI